MPNGVGGVEERLSLLFTEGVLKGKIDMNRFVELISTNAAKLFGLYPKKGVIAVGSDSDIVVWNPNLKRTVSVKTQKQNSDINIYEGMELKGLPEKIVIGTNLITLNF
jgi:dihydropyrimidinase